MEYILHHIDERRCFCPKCSRILTQKHGVDTQFYKCQYCDITFWVKEPGTTERDIICVDDIYELEDD